MQQIQPRSIGLAAILTAFEAVALSQFRPKPVAVAISSAPPIQAVTALGRFEPKGEVIQLAANTPGSRIADLRVKLGEEAKATLARIAEVRPVDVDAAQAEVKSAIVAVQQVQAEVALTVVRAPRDGQILKIHTWEGELVDSKNGFY